MSQVQPAPNAAANERVEAEIRGLRLAVVPVRLTRGERDQLADVARDIGLSLSTYMRQVVLSRPLPSRRAVRPIPEVNRETYHALGRLAADLNHMARRTGEHPTEMSRPVLEALNLVARLVGQVRAEVLGTTFDEGGTE